MKGLNKYKKFRKMALFGGIIILIMVIAPFIILNIRQHKLILNTIEAEANALFENIVLTRRWNAEHGGVFVLKENGMESNPYLENPDIKSVDGKVYTMKNPAMMTREISEYAKESNKFSFHITSLKPINPNNKPDDWERHALQLFNSGVKKVTAIDTLNGQKVFRLMRPLIYEYSCVQCHANQGYKIGDIRGGISVSIPFEKVSEELKVNQWLIVGLILSLSALICFVFYFYVFRLMNQLANLNKTKDELLGIAAHDLRNPLSVIMGYCQILSSQKNALNESQLRIIEKIQKNSNTMLNLINDLLDISKIEAGRLNLNKQKTDITTLIKENIELHKLIAKNKKIRIHFKYDKDIPTLYIDPQKIDQVLNNLITNAIKFSYPNSNINVKLSRDDEFILIEVKDEGQGIPEKELESIFKPFSKSSVKSTGGEKSTGLGLAITKKIIEGHNGSIWVESKVGKGSRFCIRLPII